jgi:uncharacterized protein involved in exopolysaccharide biosynthesis
MTPHRHGQKSRTIREIVRLWPVLILTALLAVGATAWSQSRLTPSYTATTRLVVVPLPQSDETFFGTSVVRDTGDATQTAATTAAELDSARTATVVADYLGRGWTSQSVESAVSVSAFEDTNVIEVTAESADPGSAVKLADGFAKATLADRWRTISAELDRRIATFTDGSPAGVRTGVETKDALRAADEASARLQTLKTIRSGGSDPTIRIDSTSPAVRSKQMPVWVILGLATVGGLFVGLLAAVGTAMLRLATDEPKAPIQDPQLLAPTPAYSPNGGSQTQAHSDGHARPRSHAANRHGRRVS